MNRNIKSLSLITKQAMTVKTSKHNAADSIDDKRVNFANFLNTTSKKELFVDDESEDQNKPNDRFSLKNKHEINYGFNLNSPSPFSTIKKESNTNENRPELKKYIAEQIIPTFSSAYNLVNNGNSSSNEKSSNYASSSLEEIPDLGSPQIINIYNINNNYNIGNISLGKNEIYEKLDTCPTRASDKLGASNNFKLSFGNMTVRTTNIGVNNNKHIKPKSLTSINTNTALTSANNMNTGIVTKVKSNSFINIAGSISAKESKDKENKENLRCSATDRKVDKSSNMQLTTSNILTIKKVNLLY